jgi:hypothetical protein
MNALYGLYWENRENEMDSQTTKKAAFIEME